jgi:D-glycero-alpha-D-manno-heptose-7-phosphate kinase
MVITQTPFRVSFFGGGTDFPLWFREHGGSVLSTTIDKFCFISCRKLPPFFEHKHRIVYSFIENVKSPDEIKHPAVRAVMQYLEVETGLEVHHDGDLPARSGIGSSSAFTVGFLNAMRALRGEACSKESLAKEAIHIEQEVLHEAVGSQDQIAVTYGGLNRIDLRTDGSFAVTPVVISLERRTQFEDSLLLFYTGRSRISSNVSKATLENMDKGKTALRAIHQIVDEATKSLQSDKTELAEIGKLLHESWLLKRSLSKKVSAPEFDDLYETGRKAGALGGKLIGAGGGGFILFFVEPDKRKDVRAALSKLLEVPIRFERDGSKVIYFNPS